jgi:hypothetical protein
MQLYLTATKDLWDTTLSRCFSVSLFVRLSYKTTTKYRTHLSSLSLTYQQYNPFCFHLHFSQRHLPITQLWLLMVRDQRKPWLFKMRIANPSRPSLSLSVLCSLSLSRIYLPGFHFIPLFMCFYVCNSYANRSHAYC